MKTNLTSIPRPYAASLAHTICVLDGISFDLRQHCSAPDSGYYVCVHPELGETHPLDRDALPDHVAAFIAANAGLLLADDSTAYFGAWVDGGKVYLDVSTRFEDRDEALARGRAANQRAIYDAANGVCIDVTETSA